MASPHKEEQETSTAISSVEDHESYHHGKHPHLSMDIPLRSMPGHPPTPKEADAAPTPGSSSTKVPNLPVTPGSSSSKGSALPKPHRSSSFRVVKSLLPGGSFKSSGRGREAAFPIRSMSFSKFFSARIARASSLPVDNVSGVQDGLSHEASKASSNSSIKVAVHIHRSQSLPMNMKKLNAKSFKRMDSLGGVYRIIPSMPRSPATSCTVPDIVAAESGISEDGEDIPEEEAVCRICMVELSEGSDTLKLECSCKGELALAHKDCAVKWFSIKGNRTCDVCREEVQNLPVTLLRVQSVREEAGRAATAADQARYRRYRMWHGTPILVIISILAYFCFLEQLLVADNGTAALAISLPFSCILGLFSSLTTTSMVARRFVWFYAAVQFLFVVFFTHLFYRYLHMQAVISIILATFAGFGVAMTGNSIAVEVLRWRARRRRLPPPGGARRGSRARPTQAQPPAPHDEQPPAAEVRRDGDVDVENPPPVVPLV